ncbi:MAG: class I SAM-dependent methyltransferase [Calothrix sp. CSU_2_0]|nr:class I SAM-dependent methyltransferase [Calothrix sp. CSU_2_0]
MILEKTDKNYWDSCWQDADIPSIVNPHITGIRNYNNRKLHQYFSQVLSGRNTKELKLLEIGCARSTWLPYFAKEFGFNVCGLDYSEIGCKQAKAILSNSNIEGDIVCTNFFQPPDNLIEAFDVVVSFGVVEHFEDTAQCISAFSKFLKPNGIIITIIPNMVGLMGWTQKIFNKPVFDIHMPLDLKLLTNAHEVVGFKNLNSCYLLSLDFGVCNLNGLDTRKNLTKIKGFIIRNLSRFSKIIWLIEKYLKEFTPNKTWSPNIVFAGTKKADIFQSRSVKHF